jgi:hypothetical protein
MHRSQGPFDFATRARRFLILKCLQSTVPDLSCTLRFKLPEFRVLWRQLQISVDSIEIWHVCRYEIFRLGLKIVHTADIIVIAVVTGITSNPSSPFCVHHYVLPDWFLAGSEFSRAVSSEHSIDFKLDCLTKELEQAAYLQVFNLVLHSKGSPSASKELGEISFGSLRKVLD